MSLLFHSSRARIDTAQPVYASHIWQRIVWRRIAALLVAAMGVANMVSSLLVHVMERQRIIHALLPLEIIRGTRALALVAGLALLAVSRGLWRGKRWTWGLTIGLLLGSALFHMLKGLDWEEALAALGIAAIIGRQRAAFRVRADAPSLRRAAFAIGASSLVLIGYTLIGGWLLRSQFSAPLTPALIARELIARLALQVGPLHAVSRRARWFLDSLSITGLSIGGYLAGALLRPLVSPTLQPSDRQHARQLLRRYGRSSLGPFALLDDKSLFFGQRVDGMLAYRVAGDIAVVCGDPVVAPADLRALMDEFMHFCVDHGWQITLYEVQGDLLDVYAELGLRSLKIGEDAWIDLKSFTLSGKRIADIRHAVSKIERDGLQFAMLADDEPLLWHQMHELAAAQDRGVWELQFSIGRLPDAPDPEARYALALAPNGKTVLGFCVWLPLEGVNGWALDVMQRHPDAPNGTMEYLIAQSLLVLQRTGAEWASLGVAPLADTAVDSQADQSLLQRGVRFMYQNPRINELYRYKSLFFFKRKFAPQWRSVYLVYGTRLSLPQVLYAVLKVHLPTFGPAHIARRIVLREAVERPTSAPAPAIES